MAELTTDREPPSIPADRPAVNDMAGYHRFEPSEFAPQSGRCDRCGGGELAEIHQKPVDQMARIAGALEEIAGALHRIEDYFREVTEGDTTDAYCKFMEDRGLYNTGPTADAGKVAFHRRVRP